MNCKNQLRITSAMLKKAILIFFASLFTYWDCDEDSWVKEATNSRKSAQGILQQSLPLSTLVVPSYIDGIQAFL